MENELYEREQGWLACGSLLTKRRIMSNLDLLCALAHSRLGALCAIAVLSMPLLALVEKKPRVAQNSPWPSSTN
jgi:hypothetical protein